MNNPSVLVIGSTGMLGSAVTLQLRAAGLKVIESSRTTGLKFNAEFDNPIGMIESSGLREGDYIVNCVGLTKTHIDENKPETVARATRLNTLFPISLATAAEEQHLRVIQVATDCVFSGKAGNYTELAEHDAGDAYGKSKSLGEVRIGSAMHLRCSLIGPETNRRRTLFFEWVRGQKRGSIVNGFTNHLWNGLTSLTFSKIVSSIVEQDAFKPGLQHLVPDGVLSKYELIKLELSLLGRRDVRVKETIDQTSLDRTLATANEDRCGELFKLAGYARVPSIREMMDELPWEALRRDYLD